MFSRFCPKLKGGSPKLLVKTDFTVNIAYLAILSILVFHEKIFILKNFDFWSPFGVGVRRLGHNP